MMPPLDPHQRPPNSIRDVYKKYQRMKPQDLDDIGIVHIEKDLDQDPEIVHRAIHSSGARNGKVTIVGQLESELLTATFRSFAGDFAIDERPISSVKVYEHEDMPGLHIIPNLLPPEIQTILLSRLLHRDLSCPSHLTNVHTHYDLNYPPNASSFFSVPPTSSSILATPLDPTVHKPLTVSSLLNRKMRWTTLGGQYDWTQKCYPDSPPPGFPSDIKHLLEDLFPGTKAEAAIVNLYSPGDTLSVHRDVAEDCGKGLVSVSLGCDAIFVIGTSSPSPRGDSQEGEDQVTEKVLTLRLRSGSAIYMSRQSRFAWHGVPQIVKDSCPEYLKSWPAGCLDGQFDDWKGWMSGKRVNLNVRQMRD